MCSADGGNVHSFVRREKRRTEGEKPDEFPSFIGAMVAAAVLKLYFIGTALTFLAVLYGLVDSVGGLMYVQDHDYILYLDHQTQRELTSTNHRRGQSVTKNIGS
ncbi:hypothetical protein Q5P01_003641 [Channa striata]|uniref:Uncharacterized protein n=1 Tax=Channa striata TaxID=64152 RepID=A0AA88T4Y1_CHASR|nr:hypothetical protein Q5P01_003641 [Channa striata]